MRVYNGTKSQLDLPLSGIQRITIPANAVSGDIMPSTEFLSLLVGSYDYSEIALIVSGPYEINMCAGVSGAAGFVVQSLEEAIERFAPKETATIEEAVPVVEQPVVSEPETCTCEAEEKREEVVEAIEEVEETKCEEEDCKKPMTSKKTKKNGK